MNKDTDDDLTDEGTTDGGPAFPSSDGDSDPRNPGWRGDGVSKRDYFAAKAMHGIMTGTGYERLSLAEDVARAAYEISDAMLKERAK